MLQYYAEMRARTRSTCPLRHTKSNDTHYTEYTAVYYYDKYYNIERGLYYAYVSSRLYCVLPRHSYHRLRLKTKYYNNYYECCVTVQRFARNCVESSTTIAELVINIVFYWFFSFFRENA